MATTAFQIAYRQEFIAGFEQRASWLRSTVTTEAIVKGNQGTFLVADSGGTTTTTAVTRGVNGLIPARNDNLNQFTATLNEWHDLVQRTDFNIFASQGDGRRIMQQTSMGVINRKIDQDILSALSATTTRAGATAQTMSLNLVVRARTILGNNYVDLSDEDNLFFAISPAAEAYLLQVREFGSADYVDVKPLVGPARRMRRWAGFNWIVHPTLAGAGTASETLYAYHRSAIGQAIATSDIDSVVGYNEEQKYSYARTSLYMGSKLLQNGGVCKVLHDGSAYVSA